MTRVFTPSPSDIVPGRHATGDCIAIRELETGSEKACQTLAQEENHERQPTLVVGKKPHGKSQMKASELIQALEAIVTDRGDLPVTVVCGMYEYSITNPGFADQGPLPNIADIQKQQDLPRRIVLEAKDSIL